MQQEKSRALEITALGNHFTPIGRVIDERAIVNCVVGLHATGGSTNLTIHLIAMAAAAGIARRRTRPAIAAVSAIADQPGVAAGLA